jgi:hypothetical protein
VEKSVDHHRSEEEEGNGPKRIFAAGEPLIRPVRPARPGSHHSFEGPGHEEVSHAISKTPRRVEN